MPIQIKISTLHLLKETITDDEKTLLNALKSNDKKVLKSIAHRIKPNLYLLGLTTLGKYCNEIGMNNQSLDEIKKLSAIVTKSLVRLKLTSYLS